MRFLSCGIILYMESVWILVVFLCGLIIGSFLNVVILRLNTGKSTGGRSACMYCGKSLKVIELIPLLSFFYLKGKCSRCKIHISLMYPIVEFLSGILYVIVFYLYGFSYLTIVFAFIASLSLIISSYDIKHFIVPQKILNILWFIAVIYILLRLFNSDYLILLYNVLLSQFIFSLPIFLLWFATKGRAMGFGDVKLTIPLALTLAPGEAYIAIIMSFVIGAMVSLFILIFNNIKGNGTIGMKTEIPFAPFLFAGYWFAIVISGLNLSAYVLPF